MPSCLGLYIENNMIKYAKVSKDRDIIKVEIFGVKFYDKLDEAIEQIINETYSYKIPISVNLSEEMYNYFNILNILNKNDLKQSIKTEFEFLCEEKGFNPNALADRYFCVNNLESRDTLRVINISINKTEIIKKLQQLEKYKLTSILPLPISIATLADIKLKDNSLIVNIEEKTKITTISNGQIYKIDIIEQGMGDILQKINMKENSYAKAYEICKNATIYTSEDLNIVKEEKNDYLEDIMPTLYDIVTEIKSVINNSTETIEKIYLTGSAITINNVDLYFQQYFPDATCEILKAEFLNQLLTSVNIKDYMEVNSAIALGLHGLKEGVEGVNFKEQTFMDKLNITTSRSDKPRGKSNRSKIDLDLSRALDATEKMLIRFATGLGFATILFVGLSIFINSQINLKIKEADVIVQDANKQIALVQSDITKLDDLTAEYKKLKTNLDELNEKLEEKYRNKNNIPNLLNKIMFDIPTGVQLTLIENTTDKHIRINAQANKYEELGYFKAGLEANGILINVKADSGVKQDSLIKVTIEGDLP